jgi:hypothetical protein
MLGPKRHFCMAGVASKKENGKGLFLIKNGVCWMLWGMFFGGDVVCFGPQNQEKGSQNVIA